MFLILNMGVMLCFFGVEGPKDVHRIFSAFSDRARLGHLMKILFLILRYYVRCKEVFVSK